jgi:hypothetical protein
MDLLRSEGVLLKVLFDLRLSRYCHVDLSWRHVALLGEAVGYDDDCLAREEVQHPVVDALIGGAKLVDAIPEEVCLWAPELMTRLGETVNSRRALGLHLPVQSVEPLQKRYGTILCLPKEEYFSLGQFLSPCSQFCELQSRR